jgi:pSer/pThr/pTyr-binding forkhead associated (FHA) protein
MVDDGAAGNTPDVPAAVEKTQPWRLRELAPRLAQRRRRALGAELTFKRARTDVRIPLERNETVIGRDPTCDIVLPDPTVSVRHARIVRGAGGYFELEDLGSTNGVVADGECVDRMTLQDGDTFVVGDTRFTVLIATLIADGT